jgi:hypothetical protein
MILYENLQPESDENEDIFEDEEWDEDLTAAENVESLVEKFIYH